MAAVGFERPPGSPAKMSAKERLAMLKQGLDKSMASVNASMLSANSCSEEAATMMAKKFVDVPPERLSHEIAAVYTKFDNDGNGNLDRDEFRAAMTTVMGRRLTDEETDVLLCEFDEDGDGLIDSREFEHLVRFQIKVSCDASCEICQHQLRRLSGEPDLQSEHRSETPSMSRPQSAQHMRCKNFAMCGFQGALRMVASHELVCGSVKAQAGHSISGPRSPVFVSPSIILPPIANASLSPEAGLFGRISSAPGSYLGSSQDADSRKDPIIRGRTDALTRTPSGAGPGGLLARATKSTSPEAQDRQALFGGVEFSRAQSLHTGPSGFTRTASNSSQKSNENLSQAERVRRLGLQISMRSESITRTASATSSVLSSSNDMIFQSLACLPKEKISAKVREMFDMLDKDGSGTVDSEEIRQGFATLGVTLTAEEAVKWVAEVDVDGNGELDIEEFEHTARRMMHMACEVHCPCCKQLACQEGSEPKAQESSRPGTKGMSRPGTSASAASAPAFKRPIAPKAPASHASNAAGGRTSSWAKNRGGKAAQAPKPIIEDVNKVVASVAALLQRPKLSLNAHQQLAKCLDILWFMDGDIVAKQDDACTTAYVLGLGTLVKRDGRTKKGAKLGQMAPGESIWITEILTHAKSTGVKRSCTLVADGKCKVAVIALKNINLVESAIKAAIKMVQEEDQLASAPPPVPMPQTRHFKRATSVDSSLSPMLVANVAPTNPRADKQDKVMDSLSSIMSQIDGLMKSAPSVNKTTSKIFDLSSIPLDQVSAKVKECFDELDSDGQGELTHSDIKEGCLRMGKTLTDEEVDVWITEADADGSGTIDLEEFEHIQRKAFGISCAPECNICCMVAMSANKTTESPERLSPEGPGESLLRQRMRKSQIKSVLCNEHIKMLGSTMIQTDKMQMELNNLLSGFKRTYSEPTQVAPAASPSEPPATESTAAKDEAEKKERESRDLEEAIREEEAAMQREREEEEARQAAEAKAPEGSDKLKSALAQGMFAGRKIGAKQASRLQANVDMQEEMERLRARQFRRARSAEAAAS